jgi:single-strand DNA-binding protein
MPTQWVNASLWGERAEKLAQYIQKGNQIYVQLTDLHLDTYTKKDGTTSASIKAMVQDLQLIGGRRDDAEPHQQFTKPAEKYPAGDPFAGLDDGDVPF